uniref:hypothetical protein n=1 Tax=Rhodaphanes brevistipitata TaxID=446136 RepID=UPI001FCDCCF3|nr:hypothetical protein MW432_pgp093 [Rhodaphanes brevistipitata]UNJ18488.1 hypothetical protein [Rhodaphanes brevistipitata]
MKAVGILTFLNECLLKITLYEERGSLLISMSKIIPNSSFSMDLTGGWNIKLNKFKIVRLSFSRQNYVQEKITPKTESHNITLNTISIIFILKSTLVILIIYILFIIITYQYEIQYLNKYGNRSLNKSDLDVILYLKRAIPSLKILNFICYLLFNVLRFFFSCLIGLITIKTLYSLMFFISQENKILKEFLINKNNYTYVYLVITFINTLIFSFISKFIINKIETFI